MSFSIPINVQDEHFRAYELPTYEILIHVPFYPVSEHCVFEFKVGYKNSVIRKF